MVIALSPLSLPCHGAHHTILLTGLQFFIPLWYNSRETGGSAVRFARRKEVCPLAPSTKLSLANSLRKLLQKKFLDDITVKEIVEDCEVNRQTFYYHFQDIYDLLHWFLEHETAQALDACPTWQDALTAAFQYIQDNHVIIYHIYRSSGREHLDCQFFTLSHALTVKLLGNASQGLTLSRQDQEFLTDFYMYALAGTMLGWLADDMKEDPGQLAARITFLLEEEFHRVAHRFSQRAHTEAEC